MGKGPFNPEARPKPRMLVFSGLDGSGKSTQAEILALRLQREGYAVRTAWSRWEPMVSAPLIRLAKSHLRASYKVRDEDYENFTAAKRKKMKSTWRRQLWQVMVWGEYACQIRSRVLVHLKRGTGVICDRYVYDTMIDVAINFSTPPEQIVELMNHPFLGMFPKPSKVILIDIDPETGSARKNDGTPVEYLADRRGYYISMAQEIGADVIDGRGSVEEVSEKIWEHTEDWRHHLAVSRQHER